MIRDADVARDAAERIKDEAIEWVVRLRGPDGAALKPEFEQWLRRRPEHRQAYDWASRHFEASSMLKGSVRHGIGASRSKPATGWIIGGAVAALAASIVAVLVLQPAGRHKSVAASIEPSSLSTKRGEIRTFRLADGSMVTLDTDSELSFSMDGSARQSNLKRGKARFSVVKDARPFQVTAGAGTVVAQAATFDVGYDDQRVLVRLVAGNADVQPRIRPATYRVPIRQVTAGHSICYRTSDFAASPIPAQMRDMDNVSWPSGWAEYRSVPLGSLVEQANRYAMAPIIIDGPQVSALEASGRFRLTDTDAFVGRIAEVFDLEVSRRSDGIHLARARH